LGGATSNMGEVYMTRQDKIKFIIAQEKLANNSWRWIKKADDKTVNDLYDYWTQEIA